MGCAICRHVICWQKHWHGRGTFIWPLDVTRAVAKLKQTLPKDLVMMGRATLRAYDLTQVRSTPAGVVVATYQPARA